MLELVVNVSVAARAGQARPIDRFDQFGQRRHHVFRHGIEHAATLAVRIDEGVDQAPLRAETGRRRKRITAKGFTCFRS